MTQCAFCENRCSIPEGESGICKMYTNFCGEIKERFPDMWMNMMPISIETMPILHWHPRSKILQISTIGCNFSCEGCVSEIFCRDTKDLSVSMKKASAEEIVQKAVDEGCIGISFCLNEPSVSLPSFKKVAVLAKQKGLFAGCSTNGYFTEESANEILPYLDFVNLGLKGSSDERYRECRALKGSVPPFRNLGAFYNSGVHCETSIMYIRGFEDEVFKAAERVAAISREIPFQVMRFIPFGDCDISMEPSISEAEDLCAKLSEKLDYVYLFNTPGTKWLNTKCPGCGKVLFSREFHGPMGAKTLSYQKNPGKCSFCGASISIKGETSEEMFEESGMLGGYRPTRALEMVHAIAVCLGDLSDDKKEQLFRDVTKQEFIGSIHEKINGIDTYFDLIADIAERAGKEDEGRALTDYLKEKTDFISEKSKNAPKKRVYYCMGTPLFALNAGRFEIDLVECAGGIGVNRSIEREGKPGVNITPEEFRELSPGIILVSGLFSSSQKDYLRLCSENGLEAKAVFENRIYTITPGWDFGSPRWVLGLMEIANILHPEIFSFDMKKESSEFFKKFYGIDYNQVHPNRSFFSPTGKKHIKGLSNESA
ncbi:pyruvate-formate lyase-activating enzyme [Methanomicrobium sp. W14]|uniref:radical SAM protein n=1 Tax=Methanomicrobium sp. W14 TaxID=2817839 RepID=UPI001AE14E4C|nr:radical SAM protein [Methanomicrobium sp. W14]MBP2134015.1 pyruvate-formate lyase-activating enzyme [Methanomicrobium sp. W14]